MGKEGENKPTTKELEEKVKKMSALGKIPARKLTTREWREQVYRLVGENEDPEWSDGEKSEYESMMGNILLVTSLGRYQGKTRYRFMKDELIRCLKKKYGEVNKDEQTLVEEEMENLYIEKQNRLLDEKRERRREKVSQFFGNIFSFFKRVKDGIVKRLTGKKGDLALESGEEKHSEKTNEREEFVEELRKNIGSEEKTKSITKEPKTEERKKKESRDEKEVE